MEDTIAAIATPYGEGGSLIMMNIWRPLKKTHLRDIWNELQEQIKRNHLLFLDTGKEMV